MPSKRESRHPIKADGGLTKGTGRVEYEPEHPDDITTTPKADKEDYAGFGGTDGVQSEASTEEADEFLKYDMDGKEDGMNVKSPGIRARYTRHYDAG